MAVNHDVVEDGWYTTIETQFRIRTSGNPTRNMGKSPKPNVSMVDMINDAMTIPAHVRPKTDAQIENDAEIHLDEKDICTDPNVWKKRNYNYLQEDIEGVIN